MIAHLFTLLPLGDVGFRVNLLSGLCLAATAPFVYLTVNSLFKAQWVAFCSALILVWSYYVWIDGLVAEIYTPQIFTLALTGWMLVRLYRQVELNQRVED